MYTKEQYALVRDTSLPGGYMITPINPTGYMLYDGSDEEYIKIAEQLVLDGAEIFDTYEDLQRKYPPLTTAERLANGLKYWIDNIPKEQWPKSVKDAVDKLNKDNNGIL